MSNIELTNFILKSLKSVGDEVTILGNRMIILPAHFFDDGYIDKLLAAASPSKEANLDKGEKVV